MLLMVCTISTCEEENWKMWESARLRDFFFFFFLAASFHLLWCVVPCAQCHGKKWSQIDKQKESNGKKCSRTQKESMVNPLSKKLRLCRFPIAVAHRHSALCSLHSFRSFRSLLRIKWTKSNVSHTFFSIIWYRSLDASIWWIVLKMKLS